VVFENCPLNRPLLWDIEDVPFFRALADPDVESEFTQGFLLSFRALHIRMAEIGEPFHEDVLYAGTLSTEKTAYVHDETDGMSGGGKIA
jgi:hypothetical protein